MAEPVMTPPPSSPPPPLRHPREGGGPAFLDSSLRVHDDF